MKFLTKIIHTCNTTSSKCSRVYDNNNTYSIEFKDRWSASERDYFADRKEAYNRK